MASPMTVTCFKYVGCFEFCEKIQKVQHHPVLSKLFISNLHDNQVTLVGVTFTLSTNIIAASTRIPNVGEKWYKEKKNLENHYYDNTSSQITRMKEKCYFLSLTSWKGMLP